MSATTASPGTAIRPFTFEFPEADLTDLRARIETSCPEKETVGDQSQGAQLATMQKLARYWARSTTGRIEAKLNSFPQFITEIDGLDIHFIHVRSQHENALPVIVTHGWPGSVVEQLKIIEPLTNPTAHGGDAADAFHVVIPSMPGYGFSGKPTATGWDPERIARAWGELMKRLGYTEYVAQGGDWGAIVTRLHGRAGARGLVGIHATWPGTPPAIERALIAATRCRVVLSDEEKRRWSSWTSTPARLAYAYMMASRPQTLTALADSPVGLAAFMLDHGEAGHSELVNRLLNGTSQRLTRDDVLDNITLFWLTNTGVSAARLYWENTSGSSTPSRRHAPDRRHRLPRRAVPGARGAGRSAPTQHLIHYNRLDRGGHFAAWEQPQILTEELRAAFRTLRK